LCWREASANRSNFSALRGVIMARGGLGFSGQEEIGWVLRGSLVAEGVGYTRRATFDPERLYGVSYVSALKRSLSG
jgi:hypothetical protein